MMRLYKALGYSIAGIAYAFRTQAAFRQDLMLAIAGTILACWLDVSDLQRLALIGSLLFVLVVELLNTAIEVAIDRISTEEHPLSKHAKDLGSAAVLLALLMAALSWGIILLR